MDVRGFSSFSPKALQAPSKLVKSVLRRSSGHWKQVIVVSQTFKAEPAKVTGLMLHF